MRSPDIVVAAGKIFFDSVMSIDRKKTQMSPLFIEQLLNNLYADFCTSAGINFRASYRIYNLEDIIGYYTHSELCYVTLSDQGSIFYIDNRNITFLDPNAGLVFAAKSWTLALILARISRDTALISNSFIFEIGDNGGLEAVAFCSNNPMACLIPDYQFISTNGYDAFRQHIRDCDVPWDQRKLQAFWRGSTTGQRLKAPPENGLSDDFSWLQRLKLCKIATNPSISKYCDIGITNIVQIPEVDLHERIKQHRLLRQPVVREDFMQYKIIVDIDGNSNAWSGLFSALLSGACVLKVASPLNYRQWYYDKLREFVTYLPVNATFDDFETRLFWATTHPEEMKVIAILGRALALSMTWEQSLSLAAERLYYWLIARNNSPSRPANLSS